VTLRDLASYEPVDPEGADSHLLVRSSTFGKAEPIARPRWRLKGQTVSLASVFTLEIHRFPARYGPR
jgi:hypothetical protein